MHNSVKAAVLACLVFAAGASAAPSIPTGGIVNSASYVPTGLPGDGIARGSMFAVFGTELGPEALVGAPSLPLQTTLGGTSISVTVSGVTRSAFMQFSSAGQLAAVLSSDLPAGDGTLTVTYNGMSSAPTPIKVVNGAFGIFTRNQAGFGPGIVQNYVSPSDQPVNAITDAAHPGQVVILWGSGLGAIVGDDAAAPPVGNLPGTIEVWVGGRQAAVQYAGRSSGFPAVDQINFAIPAGVVGCYVPVVVVVNGVVSNQVTIAITESGVYCSDFQTFLPGELETIVQNGQGGVAFMKLDRFRGTITATQGSQSVLVDDFGGGFTQFTAAEIVAMTPKRDAIAPIGSCTSTRFRDDLGERVDPVRGVGLEAGDELQLKGPEGTMPIPANGSSYDAGVGGGFGGDVLPEFYTPGTFVLTGGSPAADIGIFEASVTIPETPEWKDQSTFNMIDRGEDLTIQWSSVDPSKEYVVISVQSINKEDGLAGIVFCSADPALGSFTVPNRVLSTLPASSPWDGDGNPTGIISVSGDTRSLSGAFTAAGLVTGRLYVSNRTVRTVIVK